MTGPHTPRSDGSRDAPAVRHGDAHLEIRRASFPNDRALVETLFREYVAWLDEDLDFQGFEGELARLPGRYSPPGGTVLLAFRGQRAVGCVALRELGGRVAEMKRLWVRPPARSGGVGKLLVAAIEAFAVREGYTAVVLDTLERLDAATRLYESLGYERTEPYYHNPLDRPVFMRKELAPGRAR